MGILIKIYAETINLVTKTENLAFGNVKRITENSSGKPNPDLIVMTNNYINTKLKKS